MPRSPIRHAFARVSIDERHAQNVACVLLNAELNDAGTLSIAQAVEDDALLLMRASELEHEFQLSLTLCDDPFIQNLNKRWRNVDHPTDVLSFPLEDATMLGDLVISIDTARQQAAERGHATRDEIRILLVHGLLHLLGYDHEVDNAEHTEMAAAEKLLLRKVGWLGQGLIALVEDEVSARAIDECLMPDEQSMSVDESCVALSLSRPKREQT